MYIAQVVQVGLQSQACVCVCVYVCVFMCVWVYGCACV